MSKLAVILAVPAVLGVGVLAVVNLELASELDATRTRVGELEETLREVEDRAAEPGSRTGERRDEARLRALEDRITAVETRRIEPVVAPSGDDAGAAAPLNVVAAGTDVERAVTQVLEARDAARRLERREQMATRGAERILRDVEVTAEQRGSVEGLVADHVRRVAEMREQDLGPELTSERAAELREELKRGLEGVLDAAQMEAVAPRLERRYGDEQVRPDRRRGGRRGGRRREGGGDS